MKIELRKHIKFVDWLQMHLLTTQMTKIVLITSKDNNRTNNQISNLRFATPKENSQNSKLSNNNTSNVKGVCFDKKAKKNGKHK
jgi:hypothetical protein